MNETEDCNIQRLFNRVRSYKHNMVKGLEAVEGSDFIQGMAEGVRSTCYFIEHHLYKECGKCEKGNDNENKRDDFEEIIRRNCRG